MELENYFDFISEIGIRIKGTRVNIEYIIEGYNEGASPEELMLRYPGVSLEKIYATITYYLANREKTDEYVRRVRADQQSAWEEQQRNPSEFVLSMRTKLQDYQKALREQASSVAVAKPE